MSDYKGCQAMKVNIVQFIVVEVSQNVLNYEECWIIEVLDYAGFTVLSVMVLTW